MRGSEQMGWVAATVRRGGQETPPKSSGGPKSDSSH